jgi:hypothetical protein
VCNGVQVPIYFLSLRQEAQGQESICIGVGFSKQGGVEVEQKQQQQQHLAAGRGWNGDGFGKRGRVRGGC